MIPETESGKVRNLAACTIAEILGISVGFVFRIGDLRFWEERQN